MEISKKQKDLIIERCIYYIDTVSSLDDINHIYKGKKLTRISIVVDFCDRLKRTINRSLSIYLVTILTLMCIFDHIFTNSKIDERKKVLIN